MSKHEQARRILTWLGCHEHVTGRRLTNGDLLLGVGMLDDVGVSADRLMDKYGLTRDQLVAALRHIRSTFPTTMFEHPVSPILSTETDD